MRGLFYWVITPLSPSFRLSAERGGAEGGGVINQPIINETVTLMLRLFEKPEKRQFMISCITHFEPVLSVVSSESTTAFCTEPSGDMWNVTTSLPQPI